MITPELSTAIVAAAGFVVTILSIVNLIITISKYASAPDKERDQRISDIEAKLTGLERKIDAKFTEYDENIGDNLDNINTVRETMLNSTRVIMRSLQALIAHDLDGNNLDGLRESKKEINDYLLGGHLGGGHEKD